MEIDFVKQVFGFKLPIYETIILLHVCAQFASYEKSNLIHLVKKMYSDTEGQLAIRRDFMTGRTKLQKKKLVELESEDFQSDRSICLTDYGSDLFFKEDKDLFLDFHPFLGRKSWMGEAVLEAFDLLEQGLGLQSGPCFHGFGQRISQRSRQIEARKRPFLRPAQRAQDCVDCDHCQESGSYEEL